MQSGQGADGGMQGGGAVDDGHTRLDGGHPVLAGNHHDARHGLTDGIVANLIAVGTELAVGGDVDHDDAGVELLERVVAKAHLFNGAGAEVLHQHVGHLDQLPQNLLGLVTAQVDGEALLAAVVLHPVGALAVGVGAVKAGFLALQPLNLDYLGPQACQHLGATGSCLVASQVQNSNAFQWSFDCRHRSPLLSVKSESDWPLGLQMIVGIVRPW